MTLIDQTGANVVAFAYGSLDAAVAADLKKKAERIRKRTSRITQAIIETGQDLIAAKERLDHGQFTAWTEAELGIPARTAQQYMAAANRFAGKGATVAGLAPTTIYKLARKSTPPEIAAEVVQRIEAGDPLTPAQIEARLDAAELAADRQRHERARIEKAQRRSRIANHKKDKAQREAAAAKAAERERERIQRENREQQERADRMKALTAEATDLLRHGLRDGMTAESVARLVDIMDDDASPYLSDLLRVIREPAR